MTERTFTVEDMQEEARLIRQGGCFCKNECWGDDEPCGDCLDECNSCRRYLMLRQGATAEAALAEAQREIARLTDRVQWFEAAGGVAMSTRIHELMNLITDEQELRGNAETALAAERQKVTALRERIMCSTSSPDEVEIFNKVLDMMDAVGMAGLTAAQPPQDAEPAT